MKYCKEHEVPLDFVSWHMYTKQPQAVYTKAGKVQDMLNRYGFSHAESILDEWNYFPGNWNLLPFSTKGLSNPWYLDSVARRVQGAEGAAVDATVLILLQNTTVKIANFYQGATMVMFGMFDENGLPHKNYYTFKAFHSLLETPERVEATSPGPHWSYRDCGAVGGQNTSDSDNQQLWHGM